MSDNTDPNFIEAQKLADKMEAMEERGEDAVLQPDGYLTAEFVNFLFYSIAYASRKNTISPISHPEVER